MLYGWVCPRCNKVNAPWVKQCDCNKNTRNSNVSNETICPDGDCCKHQWVMSNASKNGVHYRCAHCGTTKIDPWQSTNNYISGLIKE